MRYKRKAIWKIINLILYLLFYGSQSWSYLLFHDIEESIRTYYQNKKCF